MPLISNTSQVAVYVDESGVTREVKRAAISGATSGNNTLVAAVTGYKIRVLSLFIKAASSVAIRLEDGAGGAALTGVMTVADHLILPHNPHGWVQTSAATLLNMELGGAIQVSGGLTYVEVE